MYSDHQILRGLHRTSLNPPGLSHSTDGRLAPDKYREAPEPGTIQTSPGSTRLFDNARLHVDRRQLKEHRQSHDIIQSNQAFQELLLHSQRPKSAFCKSRAMQLLSQQSACGIRGCMSRVCHSYIKASLQSALRR